MPKFLRIFGLTKNSHKAIIFKYIAIRLDILIKHNAWTSTLGLDGVSLGLSIAPVVRHQRIISFSRMEYIKKQREWLYGIFFFSDGLL
jgi:hypothetical protein